MVDDIKAPIAVDDKMPPAADLGEIVVAQAGDAELLGTSLLSRHLGSC